MLSSCEFLRTVLFQCGSGSPGRVSFLHLGHGKTHLSGLQKLWYLCHWNNRKHITNFTGFLLGYRWAGGWEKAVNGFHVSLQCWCREDRDIHCHWPPDSADWNWEYCGCVWSGVWSSNASTFNGADWGKIQIFIQQHVSQTCIIIQER